MIDNKIYSAIELLGRTIKAHDGIALVNRQGFDPTTLNDIEREIRRRRIWSS